MAFQHAGRFRAAAFDGAGHRDRAEILLQCLARDAAGPQKSGAGAGEVEHGGFDADLAGAAIEDHRHVLGQLAAFHMLGDMARRGRADAPRWIGAGRRHRAAGRLEQFESDRMIGDAHRQTVEPGRGQQRHRAVLAARQHQSQRAGPNGVREALGAFVEIDQAGGLLDGRHMDDQRVEARPALGGEDRGHRPVVGGIAAQPIDGLGGEGDQPAGAQQLGARGDVFGSGGNNRHRRVFGLFFNLLNKQKKKKLSEL